MNEEQINIVQPVEAVEEGNLDWTEQATPSVVLESWSEPFLGDEEIDELQSRWNSLQVEFVDGPRDAVEQANALVAEAMDKVTSRLSENRAVLDEQWINHEDVSTEDLRIALQRYRSFFNRLLTL